MDDFCTCGRPTNVNDELIAAAREVIDRWEHGDLAAAVRNLNEVLNTTEKNKPLTVVVLEGGCVNDVLHMNGTKGTTIDYTIIDWDIAETEPERFWNDLVPDIQEYIKNNLPDQYESLQKNIKGL